MKKRTRIWASAALVLGLAGTGAMAAEAPPAAPAPAAKVAAPQVLTAADLVAKMPAASVAEGRALAAALVKLGAPGLKEAVGLLVTPGQGDDAKARFALNGVAWHVNRPGAAKERALFAKVLIQALEGDAQPGVKVFVVNLLQLVGKDEAVAPLSKLLGDAELGEPAAKALLNIRTPAVVPALLQALPAAQGASRVTLIHALGQLQAGAAVKLLLPLAGESDAAVRQASLDALAAIGDPAAQELLLTATRAQGTLERAHATANALLFARRLAQRGAKAQAVAICRDLIKTRTAPREVNVVVNALSTLVTIQGKATLPELLTAVDSPNKQLRAGALSLTRGLAGGAVTQSLVAKLKDASPEAKVDILYALRVRGDKAAVPAVLAALQDADAGVRMAAVDAAAHFATPQAAAALLALAPADPDEATAVQAALLRLPPARMSSAAAAALPKATSSAQRLALLQFLGARRAAGSTEAIFACTADADAGVRAGALKALGKAADAKALPRLIDLLLKAPEGPEQSGAQDAVVAICGRVSDPEARVAPLLTALSKTTGSGRMLLLEALAQIGGSKALQTILAETKSEDAAARDGATRLIAGWDDPVVAPELLKFARTAGSEAQQVLALRGYIRLVGAVDRPAAEAVRLYNEALAVCKRPEEKRLVIAGLGGVRDAASLKAVAVLVDDPAVGADAVAAALRIAAPPTEKDQPLKSPEAIEVLKQLATTARDGEARNQFYAFLKKYLSSQMQGAALAPQAKPDAEGFVPLSGGDSLAGWVGAVNGYCAANGIIACVKELGGNLYTEKEYSDFTLRFEFRLTPGANNGIGIRAPLSGDAAYVGMEIQVLDDTAEVYKSLQPYQYHGSVYGVAPCERGHQKPLGEWNVEEITARGRQITIKLNGATITDVDLDQASANGTRDHREHPGLKNERGHIGFLGHGSLVEFRNIRIKDLSH